MGEAKRKNQPIKLGFQEKLLKYLNNNYKPGVVFRYPEGENEGYFGDAMYDAIDTYRKWKLEGNKVCSLKVKLLDRWIVDYNIVDYDGLVEDGDIVTIKTTLLTYQPEMAFRENFVTVLKTHNKYSEDSKHGDTMFYSLTMYIFEQMYRNPGVQEVCIAQAYYNAEGRYFEPADPLLDKRSNEVYFTRRLLNSGCIKSSMMTWLIGLLVTLFGYTQLVLILVKCRVAYEPTDKYTWSKLTQYIKEVSYGDKGLRCAA